VQDEREKFDMEKNIQPFRSQAGRASDVCLGVDRFPLVSIVVVAFRDRDEVEALISNVAPFRGAHLELIIVDGGSEDGTVQLLEARADEIDYWISERDTGIYDAMNKGVAAARGLYILHLNSGDRLVDLPLVELRGLSQRQVDVVCCRVLEDSAHVFTPRNNWLIRIDNPWHHQGTFYRRTSHLGYDSSYRVFGDFDHNQRLRKANRSVELLDVVVATHKTDGISGLKDDRAEIFRSIRTNFGFFYLLPAFIRFKLISLRAKFRRLTT
jgi:glycosyltransferase involved in cell wall biosynthesis